MPYAGDPADLGGGIDQPAVGRNPGDRDQAHAIVDHHLQRPWVKPAVRIVENKVDHRAGALRDLKVGQVVGGIFRGGRQDAVAGLEA